VLRCAADALLKRGLAPRGVFGVALDAGFRDRFFGRIRGRTTTGHTGQVTPGRAPQCRQFHFIARRTGFCLGNLGEAPGDYPK
jgi:hypothetical protein